MTVRRFGMKHEQRKWLTRTELKTLTLFPRMVVRKVECPSDKITYFYGTEAYRGEGHR
jgi:hypothetical protein